MPYFSVTSGSNNIKSNARGDMGLICDATVPWAAPPPSTHQLLHHLLQHVWPSLCCQSPSPVHRKLASSDPHQTSRMEARGPGKQVPGGGEGCGGGGAGKGRDGRCLFFMGGVPSGGLCRFGPVPLAPPTGSLNLTYLALQPPPNIPAYFVFLRVARAHTGLAVGHSH